MCTVTYVYSNGKSIITSNRDEKTFRESAIEPKSYLINNKKITFPKDQKAGGTWFAISENQSVIVLLNGAAEKHILKPSYKKSRGLIVLDIISAESSISKWNQLDLVDIEPFTLVLFEENKLYQLRWNETEKETVLLNATKNYIWSSATLYPKNIREQRANWFTNFIDTKPEITAKEMFNFHRYTENNDAQNGLVINRNDEMKTLSITQVVLDKNQLQLSHNDLIQNKEFTNTYLTL
jgi:hypothetical protein